MGTPEFPNLGKHCFVDECRQIDFLPFTCDCCHQVFCLEHRSYNRHNCPTANKNDVSVVVCPLCAKGVRLIPDEDPNITWESHVNTECDPSNYEKATKKRKCPVPGCREILTFSNIIKCRECTIDHCLKHRFGPDHKCPGRKKPESSAFPFVNFRSGSRQAEPKKAPATSSSSWTSTFFKAAEAGMAKLGSGRGQSSNATNHSGRASGQVEQCPQCSLRFSSVTALVSHVQKVHEKNGVMNLTVDVCPRCSKGFRDPVSLVEHVEKEHKGTSKA
ncbi:Zinc finger AN1 and C2H2 domain-containing stress-associated protein 16 [Capsicum annuum]|uniref:Zinc finger AN1 and C2H2 domain-containing stress-associated protein 16 n=1 Tax=Capsicum annuum TaxID=4072 RepID=A0A1U8EIL5_CAPAN|nr:zinc finger AN1 and C2H2 domain-containing stress-associated protein 11 [Capsicum annuum]KAF3636853.1 Zinc finger AN1 and C2H2 domain-containing stress-associated protein 16 [Capsicum annuum]KAF3638330.1 Zinc finger AN1 and C2H2 domain-containing stress-associated protein 16 [Capsicum annuum]PHT71386.1 Zinc finger AN1 and C2H2 domain-containing stress-associated protein 16 [Capsicum annuum]